MTTLIFAGSKINTLTVTGSVVIEDNPYYGGPGGLTTIIADGMRLSVQGRKFFVQTLNQEVAK